ncbi:MAG: radical SAM family heme chaperone HemW [Lachnospiraceae bacterium]|nr:radical SAM family heme chaperone HemW [Lachnospiraceae bacterium]
MRKELELYVHIPFCVRKCAYCDFLSAPASVETMRMYADSLLEEIRRFPDCYRAGEGSNMDRGEGEDSYSETYEVSTVFFGGGTPSIFPPEWLTEILDALRKKFRYWSGNTEITIECNPGTVDENKFRAYRGAGINRLSLGLQSANQEELELLGRIHTWEEFLETYHAARRAGFENINVDLMSALPGQSAESWEKTLKQVLALNPEHISAYSLIIEEGTPFYEKYHTAAELRDCGMDCPELPSEEEERLMYELTETYLKQAGMHRYEISNYAKPGFECRHNCGYWKRTDYLGFGLGAASLLADTRYRNTDSLSSYIKMEFTGREAEKLSVEDQMEEFMFLGLRMTEGVSEKRFHEIFGDEIDAIYGDTLNKWQREGLLQRENGNIFLTARGINYANLVMAEFLL